MHPTEYGPGGGGIPGPFNPFVLAHPAAEDCICLFKNCKILRNPNSEKILTNIRLLSKFEPHPFSLSHTPLI